MSEQESKGIFQSREIGIENRSGACHFDELQNASEGKERERGRALNDTVASTKEATANRWESTAAAVPRRFSCRWSSIVASRRMHLRVTRRTAAVRGIHWITASANLSHPPPLPKPPLVPYLSRSLSVLSGQGACALIVAIIALSCNYVLEPTHLQCSAHRAAQTAPSTIRAWSTVREIETTRCYNGMLTSATRSSARARARYQRASENVAHRRIGVFGTVRAAVGRPIDQENDFSAINEFPSATAEIRCAVSRLTV